MAEREGSDFYYLTILDLLNTHLVNTLDITRTIGQW
jgi:hypothetical protein